MYFFWGWERDRNSASPSAGSLHKCLPRPKSGNGNASQVSHVGDSKPLSELPLLFPETAPTGSWSQELEPGIEPKYSSVDKMS